MDSALLVATGPNSGTLKNVLFAIDRRVRASLKINKILVLDVEESLPATVSMTCEQIMDCGRTILGREIEVRKLRLTGDLQDAIPKLIVDGAREVGRPNLIIDITSGLKTVSAILYASGSFSRLNHVYYVNVGKRDGGFINLWEEMDPDAGHTLINLAPLKDVQNLAALSHFDLIFYLDALDRFDESASTATAAEVRAITHQIRAALRQFFEHRDNLAAMRAIGTSSEHLTGLVYRLPQAIDPAATVADIKGLEAWSKGVRAQLKARTPPAFAQHQPITHVLDHAVELLRAMRNAAAHKNPPGFSGQEVRTGVNLVLNLLEAVVSLNQPGGSL